MTNNITFTYPGFTRRALTFTIDDGNITYDKKFIDIVRPNGIRGTFNLCSRSFDMEDGYYREIYRGFGIANHTSYHPYALDDAASYIFSDEPPKDQPVDEFTLYLIPGRQGYFAKKTSRGWREVADDETYFKCISECQARLEQIFGKGSVRGFVWPFCEQNNARVKQYISDCGFTSVRKTGDVLDTTNYAPPANRMAWSYNAHHLNLLAEMEKYENAADNGKLRFFAFGVHSWDFERDGTWGALEQFAKTYGNRPNDYWYATVDEIFDYLDAIDEIRVSETAVENPTDITVYLEAFGKQIELNPHSRLEI